MFKKFTVLVFAAAIVLSAIATDSQAKKDAEGIPPGPYGAYTTL